MKHDQIYHSQWTPRGIMPVRIYSGTPPPAITRWLIEANYQTTGNSCEALTDWAEVVEWCIGYDRDPHVGENGYRVIRVDPDLCASDVTEEAREAAEAPRGET